MNEEIKHLKRERDAYFDRLQEKRAEVERLKQAEKALLDAISDWYYLHPSPKADEVLSKQYENFLTFGQGGANFSEAQDLAEEAI